MCVRYGNGRYYTRSFGERSSENLIVRFSDDLLYSGLTLNQYGVASPCRTICTVCGFV
ncbi:MAG: hypothetical protein HXM85_12615, partial [Neisseria sp.]|nr:hypothetical protein [Neisseria sp.]